MKFYYADGDYFATKGEAVKHARLVAETSIDDIIVQLAEVATTKTNVLRLLNDAGAHSRFLEVVYTAKAKKQKESVE